MSGGLIRAGESCAYVQYADEAVVAIFTPSAQRCRWGGTPLIDPVGF